VRIANNCRKLFPNALLILLGESHGKLCLLLLNLGFKNIRSVRLPDISELVRSFDGVLR
jgi:hypothetical protein